MVKYCTLLRKLSPANSVVQLFLFYFFCMRTASFIASFHCNRWIADSNTNTIAGGYISFTLADHSIWGTQGASENSSNRHIQGNRNASLQDAKGVNKRLKSQLIFSWLPVSFIFLPISALQVCSVHHLWLYTDGNSPVLEEGRGRDEGVAQTGSKPSWRLWGDFESVSKMY